MLKSNLLNIYGLPYPTVFASYVFTDSTVYLDPAVFLDTTYTNDIAVD